MNKNYFKTLDLKEDFNLTENEIESAYFQMSEKFHPDNNSNDLIKFSDLNEAYRILKNPLLKYRHFLEINNIDIKKIHIEKEFLRKITSIDDKLILEKEFQNLNQELIENFTKNDLQKASILLIKMLYLEKINNNVKNC